MDSDPYGRFKKIFTNRSKLIGRVISGIVCVDKSRDIIWKKEMRLNDEARVFVAEAVAIQMTVEKIFRTKLKEKRQNTGEGLQELAIYVYQLTSLAKAECALDIGESLAAQYFVDATRDEDTQHLTRLMDAKDKKSTLIQGMKVVVIIFIILAVLGSLSTAFEFLYEENTERKKLSKDTDNKNFTNNLSKKDWISNSRSFLHCFCFVKNGKKLFQTDPDKKQFECFHGIRVVSNLSIICCHIGVFNIYT
ncbi:hypothetical protein AVEN_110118-1, partial [Araneus ventricosus]